MRPALSQVGLAVVGAGVIGRRHARLCANHPDCRLAAVVDSDPAVEAFAKELGAPFFVSVDAMLGRAQVDGVIVAVPTQLHEEIGAKIVGRGIHLLMEKPIAADVASARRLIAVARGGARILVGQHRRHNPIASVTRRIVQDGELGRLLAVNVIWTVKKPDAYYDVPWRRLPGAGPVLTNLIHEIDLLRFICGEITAVTAAAHTFGRGLQNEDTVGVLLTFANGAIGTITASDATPSPWGWDANTGESPALPMARENSFRFFGSEASLEFPDLHLWRYREQAAPGWDRPITREGRIVEMADAHRNQLTHFCAVVRGDATPLISAEDGVRTLAATSAILEAGASGRTVHLETAA